MHSCLDIIPDETRKVFVGFSGGLDSCVLLHLLVSREASWQIVPWHINHGLLDVADAMEAFCQQRAASYSLDIRLDRLEAGQLESNVEAQARQLRYQLFKRAVGADDCLLTAHHADDQAETFLLNALRGSGVAGLRGIAQQRPVGKGLLLRPLLKFSRAQLQAYAKQNQISWFDDPSNQDNRFDRNYLRNRVSPLLRDRWPDFQNSLSQASEHQNEAHRLLDDLAQLDYQQLKLPSLRGISTLSIDALETLSLARQKNVIRYWINRNGFSTITRTRLLELLNQLSARSDSQPEIAMPDYAIRVYDRRLFLVSGNEPPFETPEYDFGTSRNIEIGPQQINLKRETIFEWLDIEDRNQSLVLKYRHSENSRGDQHRLKRLFQNHRVPPWERDRIPLIYLDGKLEGILT